MFQVLFLQEICNHDALFNHPNRMGLKGAVPKRVESETLINYTKDSSEVYKDESFVEENKH